MFSVYCRSNDYLQIVSPDRKVAVNFCLNKKGEPMYRVSYLNHEILAPSRMGLDLSDAFLTKGLKLTGEERTTFKEKWNPVWGQYAEIVNHYNELTLSLENKANRKLQIIFRVFNDGIGFRYMLPGNGEAVVIDENSEFNMPTDNEAYWSAACFENDESLYQVCKLSKVTEALCRKSATPGYARFSPCKTGFNTPLTMKTPDGIYLSIHEAALWNYPGMSLELNPKELTMKSLLASKSKEKALVNLPFSTPWRTICIGNRAGALIESSLILNLNEPCKLTDVSWIKPMKYDGIWWAMHVKESTWELERSNIHGANTENVKRYIDFAAQNGLGGVLVEGWNKGWDGWKNFRYTEPYPDFDMKELSQYAASKGVQIMGHHETGGDVQNYINQMDSAYAYYQQNGIHSFKTGYVGFINKHFHYDQWMVNHYNETVTKAAKYKLMVNIHEPIKPTGLCRTYPNLMSGEGMRGQEYNAWSDGNPPTQSALLPFIRNLAGPMDYTPGIFDTQLKNSPNRPENGGVHSTLANQLALYVVFYSPIQMAADLPGNYEGNEAFQFIRDVPVDWADTRVLEAEPGEYVMIARRDKKSNNWFVGAITNEQERNMTVDFSFLPEGEEYNLTIYRDKPGTSWQNNPTRYEIEKRVVSHSNKITIDIVPGGGFALSIMK